MICRLRGTVHWSIAGTARCLYIGVNHLSFEEIGLEDLPCEKRSLISPRRTRLLVLLGDMRDLCSQGMEDFVTAKEKKGKSPLINKAGVFSSQKVVHGVEQIEHDPPPLPPAFGCCRHVFKIRHHPHHPLISYPTSRLKRC